MASQRPLLLLLFVVLALSTHLSRAQHWSHGWYPGGKRELDLSQTPEVSSSLSLGGSSILLEHPQYSLMHPILQPQFKDRSWEVLSTNMRSSGNCGCSTPRDQVLNQNTDIHRGKNFIANFPAVCSLPRAPGLQTHIGSKLTQGSGFL
uniref:Gonadoliberin n=1 Tax=Pelusios castaneus TaxID=367368 RepID=A0A8C8RRI6_9SAUR